MIEKIVETENHVLVDLSGIIDEQEASKLRDSLLAYSNKGHNTFVINLEGVDYIDSIALGTFVAVNTRALKIGGKVIIVGLQGMVKELFELTRLTKVFEIQ